MSCTCFTGMHMAQQYKKKNACYHTFAVEEGQGGKKLSCCIVGFGGGDEATSLHRPTESDDAN